PGDADAGAGLHPAARGRAHCGARSVAPPSRAYGDGCHALASRGLVDVATVAARDRTGLRRARPLLAQGRRQPTDLLRGTAWGGRPVIAHAALLTGDVRFIVVASDED